MTVDYPFEGVTSASGVGRASLGRSLRRSYYSETNRGFLSLLSTPLPRSLRPKLVRDATKTKLSRRESQQRTRGKLRMAAAMAFARNGVSAASVDGITEAAGYSRGAFYSNYTDKMDLLLELMEEEQTHELAMWPALIDEAGTLEEILLVLERRFDDLHDRDGRELLMMELQLEAARNEAFRVAYEESSAKVLMRTAEVIGTLSVKFGTGDVDARIIAITLRALAIGLAARANIGGSGVSGGQVITSYLRQALQGHADAIAGNPSVSRRQAG